MSDIECTVWCAHCAKDKFRVVRRPTGQSGVYEHDIQMLGEKVENRKTCADCGEQLSRKE